MKKNVLFVLIALFATMATFAQRTVTGRVTSNDEPGGLPGVAVTVDGTSLGTTADHNGVFVINNVPENAKTLKFTYVGRKTKEVPIPSNGVVNVKMEQDNKMLEVINIDGYGVSVKAGDVGAASRVEGEVLTKRTESNVMNSLQGSMPGVQISTATGQPGAPTSVRIRGISSINSGNDPLYIVDGVPISTGGFGMTSQSDGVDPLSTINPADIESISTLKDASATSIYGSRAANGVIIITTKRGKQGQSSFQADVKIGVSTPPFVKRAFTTVNVADYKTFLGDSYLNSRRNGYVLTSGEYHLLVQTPEKIWDGIYNKSLIDFRNGNMPTETDWWDAVTRSGIIQDYSFSANGGGDRVTYYASLNYFNNVGTVIGTDFTRYLARVNVDYKATNWLTFGVNLSGGYSQSNAITNSLTYASPVWSSGQMRPTDPIKNPDGTWFTGYNLGYNPVALYSDEYPDIRYRQQYKALFSPYLRINLHKNIVFQTKFGLDFVSSHEKNVWSPTVNPQGRNMGGITQMLDQRDATLTLTNTLNWMPSIGKNNFNVLIGQEIEQFDYSEGYYNGTTFSDPSLTEVGNAASSEGFSGAEHAALSSVFLNVEYNYDDRYYISGSIRGDGTSRFGENNRWGLFYSIGGKYRISGENFMTSTQNWLNNLSIRVSYGTTGNQNVGYYVARPSYGSSKYGGGLTIYPSALGAPDLKWESRDKFNVGLEFSIFNALTAEIDYYYDITRDMIFAVPLSYSTGFSSQIRNIGKMGNQGIELMLNAQLLQTKNVQWTASFNITTNNNKILKLPTDGPIIGSSLTKLEVGKTAHLYYYYEYAGVDPATGRPRWYDDKGEYVYDFTLAKRRDLGSYDPKFYGGFTTRVNFYDFDFSVQLNYCYGGKLFVNDVRYRENDGAFEDSPPTYYVMDNRWKNPGDEAYVPEIRMGGNNGAENFSSRELMDASYLRIRNIQLGYTVPSSFLSKAKLKMFRAYISIDNLYTFTKNKGIDAFRGYDPEAGLGGTQAANYPIPINYQLGVNVGF
ncbi:MAG: SusC/RagA family TonB-linked outer membrane protein [Bacteroidales bacterium]|nr:SusC/RagA family TonB-linked outer membrane protein [Bacteroidales bacterium]